MKTSTLLVVFGAVSAMAYGDWPQITSGIVCSKHHLTITYDNGIETTIVVPPPPKTTPITNTPPHIAAQHTATRTSSRKSTRKSTRTSTGTRTRSGSPVDETDPNLNTDTPALNPLEEEEDEDEDEYGEEGEEEIQHHRKRAIFYCTLVESHEHWPTRLPVPSWLPEYGLLTASLNRYVTVTHLTTTNTGYWIDDSSLSPPNLPSNTGEP
ncbi:hypothetical protein F5Y12DRAFT_602423 [Xylaria sp. FL1777]|nr:hypothetical protein F5Y12DRAFT_602423 [Xylaria sp. FL1777]